MSLDPDTAAAELRALLRFVRGLGLPEANVRAIYDAVCQEAEEAGDIDDDARLAQVRRRLIEGA